MFIVAKMTNWEYVQIKSKMILNNNFSNLRTLIDHALPYLHQEVKYIHNKDRIQQWQDVKMMWEISMILIAYQL